MSVVLLRLEGPLQAWSAQGKLGLRDTEREPTKSGVLGMVGAALGMERDDDATLATLAALKMAVRVDRAGALLRDFHTAGSGSFRGKSYFVHGTKNCVPTERYYLQGASFVVALEGDDDVITRVAGAFGNPRWPLFLGRRSCPPSVHPLMGRAAGAAREAVHAAPRAERCDADKLRVIYEVAPGQGDPRHDVPLSFSQAERRYGLRYVVTEWTKPVAQAAEVAS